MKAEGGRIALTCVVCAALLVTGILVANKTISSVCIASPKCLLEGRLVLQQSFKFKVAAFTSRKYEARSLYHSAREFADEDGMVVWTLANMSWLDFVLNWVTNVRASGIHNYFVGCMDSLLFDALQKKGIPAVKLSTDLGAEELTWGSDVFKERGRVKIAFIKSMVDSGLQPVFSDLDVIWLRDPVPYLKSFPVPDILISLDLLAPTSFDGSLEPCPDVLQESFMGMQNVGIHLAWAEGMEEVNDMEQVVFNRVVQSSLRKATELAEDADSPSPYCRTLHENVTIGLLPPVNFANGHLYFTQGLPDWPHVNESAIYAAHTTFIAGKNAKRHYMRERKLWRVDGPERFKPLGGFVSFDMDIPEGMLEESGPPENQGYDMLEKEDTVGHIALMEHQLTRVGIAMQVSLALGRHIIMPPVWCGLDYGWGAHNGRMPGAGAYPLPFICPLGKVMDLELWTAMAQAGRLPQFYEPAALEHPLMAHRTQALVQPSSSSRAAMPDKGTAGHHSLRMRTVAGNLRYPAAAQTPSGAATEVALPRNLTSNQLRAALRGFEHLDVLHFTDVAAIWGGASENDSLAFKHATEGLVEPWCCSEGDVRIPLHL